MNTKPAVTNCLPGGRQVTALEPLISAAKVRQHYESLSFLYRLFWGEHLHHGLFRSGKEPPRVAQVALLRYCSSLLQLRDGCRVLDVGCGYGATERYLAQQYRCRCIGLTISPRQARHANKSIRAAGLGDSARFVVCDAEAYDLGTGSYDLIWTMEASEHFLDRGKFFRRAAAALVGDGSLLLSCWVARSPSEDLRRLANLCVCPDFQALDDYLEQIAAAGLRTHHTEELTRAVSRTWDIVERRMSLLMPTLRLWSPAVQQFASAISGLRRSFHNGDLQYWVLVAAKA